MNTQEPNVHYQSAGGCTVRKGEYDTLLGQKRLEYEAQGLSEDEILDKLLEDSAEIARMRRLRDTGGNVMRTYTNSAGQSSSTVANINDIINGMKQNQAAMGGIPQTNFYPNMMQPQMGYYQQNPQMGYYQQGNMQMPQQPMMSVEDRIKMARQRIIGNGNTINTNQTPFMRALSNYQNPGMTQQQYQQYRQSDYGNGYGTYNGYGYSGYSGYGYNNYANPSYGQEQMYENMAMQQMRQNHNIYDDLYGTIDSHGKLGHMGIKDDEVKIELSGYQPYTETEYGYGCTGFVAESAPEVKPSLITLEMLDKIDLGIGMKYTDYFKISSQAEVDAVPEGYQIGSYIRFRKEHPEVPVDVNGHFSDDVVEKYGFKSSDYSRANYPMLDFYDFGKHFKDYSAYTGFCLGEYNGDIKPVPPKDGDVIDSKESSVCNPTLNNGTHAYNSYYLDNATGGRLGLQQGQFWNPLQQQQQEYARKQQSNINFFKRMYKSACAFAGEEATEEGLSFYDNMYTSEQPTMENNNGFFGAHRTKYNSPYPEEFRAKLIATGVYSKEEIDAKVNGYSVLFYQENPMLNLDKRDKLRPHDPTEPIWTQEDLYNLMDRTQGVIPNYYNIYNDKEYGREVAQVSAIYHEFRDRLPEDIGLVEYINGGYASKDLVDGIKFKALERKRDLERKYKENVIEQFRKSSAAQYNMGNVNPVTNPIEYQQMIQYQCAHRGIDRFNLNVTEEEKRNLPKRGVKRAGY